MADAYKWGKDLECHLDDAAGTLTDISDYVNSQSIRTAFDVFRADGVGSDDPERQHGKADATIPLNGWVNSTTEGILGPLVGNRTSVAKTAYFGNGVKYYGGEFMITDVEFSGDPNSLQTWSCTLGQDGSVSRTSTV